MRSAHSLPAGSAIASGERGLYLYGLIFWSLATGSSALASGFGLLLAMRGLVGRRQSAYYPTATAIDRRLASAGDAQPRALSIHQTAVFAGAGARAAVATGYIAESLSWHAAVPNLRGADRPAACLGSVPLSQGYADPAIQR